MSSYIWPTIWKDELRGKFILDKDGFIKYPPNIAEVLNIIEDAVRKEMTAPPFNEEADNG